MRTILLGTDFMYNKAGQLVPVEINTSLGIDGDITFESKNEIFDLTELIAFIQSNSFNKIHYIGNLNKEFGVALENELIKIGVAYENHKVGEDSITVPYVEDSADILIIRSAYDTTAIVDEEYCKNKVGFLNLIKDTEFGSQFAYMDENNAIVNHITSIPDNGNNPNFILKAVLPFYDINVYPKLFKVSSQDELNSVIANFVNKDYFLMEYHFNENNLYQNHIQVIRSINLLYPSSLESIKVGAYTKFAQMEIPTSPVYNDTFEISTDNKWSYLVSKNQIGGLPKLEDTDLVELADGTFKTALELEVGDILKTIDIDTNGQITNPVDEQESFNINFEQLVSGSTYSTNEVLGKMKVSTFTSRFNLTFTDGSDWNDTGISSYLSLKDNNVKFIYLHEMVVGDKIIMVNTTNGELQYELKEIASISTSKEFFNGWYITVSRTHYFLTKTGSDSNTSYATIEHNIACYSKQCPPYQPGYVNGCCPMAQCCKNAPVNICQYVCV